MQGYVLFYDGTCGLCSHIARFLLRLPLRAPLKIVNAANARELSRYPQVSPHQAMQSVHLLLPDGRLRHGYDAVVALVREIAVVRWLAPLMNTWIMRKIGWAMYEFITEHRHQLSRALGLG